MQSRCLGSLLCSISIHPDFIYDCISLLLLPTTNLKKSWKSHRTHESIRFSLELPSWCIIDRCYFKRNELASCSRESKTLYSSYSFQLMKCNHTILFKWHVSNRMLETCHFVRNISTSLA